MIQFSGLKERGMTIDTGARTVRMQSQKQIFAIVSVIAILALVYRPLARHLDAWYSGLSTLLIVLIAVVYVCYQYYFVLRDIEYLLVTDTQLPGFLRVRHFPVRPLSNGRFAVEIPLEAFYSYRVVRAWRGLRTYIVLSEHQGNQVYTYPWFSITILRKREKMELFRLLDQYAKVHDGAGTAS